MSSNGETGRPSNGPHQQHGGRGGGRGGGGGLGRGLQPVRRGVRSGASGGPSNGPLQQGVGQGRGGGGGLGRGLQPGGQGEVDVPGGRGGGTAVQRGRGGLGRSRYPTGGAVHRDLASMHPDDYLALNANANTKKNIKYAVEMYERVMLELSERIGEQFESLEEASVERLPYLLQKFLQSATKSTGEVYSSGSLNTMINGISKFLKSREGEQVDIKADFRFEKVQEMLRVQSRVSASEGRGAGCDAKRPVKPEHLAAALEFGSVGRDAPRPLITAAYLATVLGMGCRTGAECYMIQNGDLTYGPLSIHGVPQWIELAERITKTRKGNPGDERELIPRLFPDDEYPETCYVRTVLAYQQKKTRAQLKPDSPFFLTINQRAAKDPDRFHYWYNNGIMGEHTVSALLTDALELAGINCKVEKYSAISLRKAMLQSGVDCDVPDMHLSRLAGHKSLVSKKDYIRMAGPSHEASSRVIHRKMYHGINQGYSEEMRNLTNDRKEDSMGSRPEAVENVRERTRGVSMGRRRSECRGVRERSNSQSRSTEVGSERRRSEAGGASRERAQYGTGLVSMERSSSGPRRAGRKRSQSGPRGAGRKRSQSGPRGAGRKRSQSRLRMAGRERSQSGARMAGRERSLSQPRRAGRKRSQSGPRGAGRERSQSRLRRTPSRLGGSSGMKRKFGAYRECDQWAGRESRGWEEGITRTELRRWKDPEYRGELSGSRRSEDRSENRHWRVTGERRESGGKKDISWKESKDWGACKEVQDWGDERYRKKCGGQEGDRQWREYGGWGDYGLGGQEGDRPWREYGWGEYGGQEGDRPWREYGWGEYGGQEGDNRARRESEDWGGDRRKYRGQEGAMPWKVSQDWGYFRDDRKYEGQGGGRSWREDRDYYMSRRGYGDWEGGMPWRKSGGWGEDRREHRDREQDLRESGNSRGDRMVSESWTDDRRDLGSDTDELMQSQCALTQAEIRQKTADSSCPEEATKIDMEIKRLQEKILMLQKRKNKDDQIWDKAKDLPLDDGQISPDQDFMVSLNLLVLRS